VRVLGLCSFKFAYKLSDFSKDNKIILNETVNKVLPIASHISFRQKSTTLAYVLEVTVTLSPFAQTSFANPLLYHEVYFLSFDFFFIYSV